MSTFQTLRPLVLSQVLNNCCSVSRLEFCHTNNNCLPNPFATVSSTKISLLTVVVNNNSISKTSNTQQKEKTDRGEMLLEPTVLSLPSPTSELPVHPTSV
jgi:hypothetical protein